MHRCQVHVGEEIVLSMRIDCCWWSLTTKRTRKPSAHLQQRREKVLVKPVLEVTFCVTPFAFDRQSESRLRTLLSSMYSRMNYGGSESVRFMTCLVCFGGCVIYVLRCLLTTLTDGSEEAWGGSRGWVVVGVICLRVGVVLIFQHAAKHKSHFYYYYSYLLNMYKLSLLSLSGFLKYNLSQNYGMYLHSFTLLIVASWVKRLACHHSACSYRVPCLWSLGWVEYLNNNLYY